MAVRHIAQSTADEGETKENDDQVRALSKLSFKTISDIGRCYVDLIVAAIPTCDVAALRARYPVEAAVEVELLPEPSSKLEQLEFDSKGACVNLIAHVRRLGFDIGHKVCLKGGWVSWTILAAVSGDEPYLKLSYSGETATVDMAIDAFRKAYPEPALVGASSGEDASGSDEGKNKKSSDKVEAAANDAGIANESHKQDVVEQPKTSVMHDTAKLKEVQWPEFQSSWEAYNAQKHYVAHIKWPRSRPINTKNFAVSCGFRGHLLDALHKACRAADKSTREGTAVVVLQEPRFETRVAAGFAPFSYLIGWGFQRGALDHPGFQCQPNATVCRNTPQALI